MVGRLVLSSSFLQHSITSLVSADLAMILPQSLSTLPNFLASIGSCLAMSPPVKTDSSEHLIIWTLTHCSSVSDASESVASISVASSRNGATWRIVSMVCTFICASSSSSIRMPVPCSVGTGRDFQSLNVKSLMFHISVISLRVSSILSCLSAPSVISPTSSATSSRCRSSSEPSLNSADVSSNSCLVSTRTSSQWRGMIDTLASSCSSGSTTWKSSICFLSVWYASYWRRRLGIFLQRSAKPSISVVMSSI